MNEDNFWKQNVVAVVGKMQCEKENFHWNKIRKSDPRKDYTGWILGLKYNHFEKFQSFKSFLVSKVYIIEGKYK